MTLNDQMLQKLVTPKPGAHMTTRLPSLCARKNAALIASMKKTKMVGGVKG